MTAEQVAAEIGMSRAFVYAEIRAGRLPAARYGRSVRVEDADLAAYRARSKQRATERFGTLVLRHLVGG